MLFQLPKLQSKELQVIDKINEIRHSLQYLLHTPLRWTGSLRRSALAKAIRGSNSIEGYKVSEEDALLVAEGEAPENADQETTHAVMNYRQAMTYVMQLARDPYFSFNEGFIRSLHFMMTSSDLTKNPGRWRPGQIFVRDFDTSEMVYEGPAAEQVPALMNELVEELNQKKEGVSVLVRAAMAHLNLVMIHPFSDGNGRMARCLQTLVLAREGILEPQFCSVEEYLGQHTQDYYQVLAQTGKGSWHPKNDTRAWIKFNLVAHYRQAKTLVNRANQTKNLWDELERIVQEKKLPERMIFALSDAAMGYSVSNNSYRKAADVALVQSSRDLQSLVNASLLKAQGEKKGRVYVAANKLKELALKHQIKKVLEDPFE